MLSEARGSLRIHSADPRVHPRLRFNYLSAERDRREWIAAIECARELFAQRAFANLDDGELSPGPSVRTDREILDWVAGL